MTILRTLLPTAVYTPTRKFKSWSPPQRQRPVKRQPSQCVSVERDIDRSGVGLMWPA